MNENDNEMKSPSEGFMSHRISLWIFPAHSISYTIRELFSFLKSWQLNVAIAPVLLIIISMNTPLLNSPSDLAVRAVFWLSSFVAYIIASTGVEVAVSQLERLTKLRSMPVFLVCIPATLFAAESGRIITIWVCSFLGQSHFVFPNYLAIYLLVLGIESMVMLFIFPGYLDEVRSNDISDEDNSSEPRTVSINGRIFAVEDLKWIKAQQHYLEVQTRTSKLTLRSTLKAVMAQLHESDGLQTNRSVWVSRSVIDLTASLPERGRVVLRNGDHLDVAKTRSAEVKEWLLAQIDCADAS